MIADSLSLMGKNSWRQTPSGWGSTACFSGWYVPIRWLGGRWPGVDGEAICRWGNCRATYAIDDQPRASIFLVRPPRINPWGRPQVGKWFRDDDVLYRGDLRSVLFPL